MDYGSSELHNIHLNDSTSSADAADVLIRSTKVAPELNVKRVASEGELSNNCNVNIFVRRLSDSTHSSCLEQTFTNGLMEQVVPPVRPANMPSAIRGRSLFMLKPSVIQRKWQKQEQDVHISRYSADGRGAVAAALKQRSHGAPQRREVKVQFLDSGSLHSSEFRGPEVQPSPAFPSGDVGGASTVAAITAAAIAATAPLIKAQSDMEARMAQVASELRRLQESEGRTDRSAESRATSDAGRVTQLEVQLTALTQQRLQHLERIQGQQLELQNRLLGSALTAVTAGTIPPSQSTHHSNSGETHSDSVQRAFNSHKCAAEDSSTGMDQSRETRAGREKSPLETPAPRKVIPRPTHWNPALQDRNGRLLEQIPNNQRSPTRYPAHTVGVRGVAIATVDSQPEQSRESTCTSPSEVTHSHFLMGENSRQAILPLYSFHTVQQAAAMLQDLSRIKNEMRTLLRTADAFPVKSAEASRSSRSSRHALPSTTPPPPPVPPVSMVGSHRAARAHPTVPQNSQPPASMFEDAGLVLRQVRHSRKVLEENLQAVLRAKDGEALHTQLEALSNNRDASEELRIKKTVDAWINTLSKDIQVKLSSHITSTAQATAVAAAATATEVARRRQQGRAEAASTQPSNQHLSSSLRNSLVLLLLSQSVVPQSEDDEAYLAKIYGKALYEGHRRTLKKGPYLRFSSPSPKSKGHRPKVIESVKGVKMKSSKTQTSMSGAQDPSSLLQPAVPGTQYLFSPSGPVQQQQQQPGCSVPGFLIPMAIPLGKPKVDGQAPLPSRVIISDKPATVITSFTPAVTPTVVPSVRKPNTVLLEVQSEQRRPTPQLQIQVGEGLQLGCPGNLTHSGEEDDDDDDDNGFPGTKFLAVADILVESPAQALFSPIELNGLPSPPAALYHGPAFPLEPRQTGPLTEPILSTIQQRETLENRLVDWVEQQLMARMISGMFPQPAQTDPANQSEPDDSVTSDIVETAGGGGLQLFVDAGVPVDSELIRQYVNEVLAEIITLMLGQREGPREPAAPASIRDTLPRQVNYLLSYTALVSEPAKTPVGTPLSSPRRIATPSPPSELAGPHNHPWGNSELPLKEEEPHSEEEENQPKPLNVLSVAREEDEEAVLPPSSPVLSKPLSPPVSAVKEAPPAPPESPSVEESSSQVSPSLTETETETAARHISEGELLLSTGQMAAVRALEEEGFNVPNLMTSFNSSLHGVQDMDYDPPSEGQVIRRPVVSAHHDPILSLLAKMEQGPVSQAQQRERYWDEESSGEVSEGQRPPLTTAQEKVVTGHSLILQQPTQSTQPTAEQSTHTTLTSPGQLPVQHTGEDSGLSINFRPSETHAETPQALQSFTASSPQPGDSTHKQRCHSMDENCTQYKKNEPLSVYPTGAELTPHAGGGVGLMSVRLPSVQKDDVSPDVSTIEGDSDSANDVF
uniref:Si:ch211-185a18.2 n=1 Tax=Astyanax mexicanus TaxID=7994 RepID=A0A8B9L320_ASTMX